MAFKQMFTTDDRCKYFKGLLYGRFGTGKTYSVRTIPRPEAVLFIAAEPGTMAISDYKVDMWKVETWKDFQEMFETVKSPEYEAYRKEKGKPPLETIFVDSLTEITKKAVDHILKERDVVVANRGKVLNTIYEDQMMIEEWGVVKPRIERIVRAFRDLPYNIIFTALEDVVKDEKRGMTVVTALMNPKSLSLDVPGLFDEFFHADQTEDPITKQIVRWWDTVDTGSIRAKDRSGKLPAQISQDWKHVFNAVKE